MQVVLVWGERLDLMPFVGKEQYRLQYHFSPTGNRSLAARLLFLSVDNDHPPRLRRSTVKKKILQIIHAADDLLFLKIMYQTSDSSRCIFWSISSIINCSYIFFCHCHHWKIWFVASTVTERLPCLIVFPVSGILDSVDLSHPLGLGTLASRRSNSFVTLAKFYVNKSINEKKTNN